MKKWAIGLLSVLLASTAMAETTDDGLDGLLKDFDLIDENYVYKDIVAAKHFFTFFNTFMNASLPSKLDDVGQVDSIELTPYEMLTSTSLTFPLTEKQKQKLIADWHSEEKIKDLCQKGMFSKRFMEANDYQATMKFYDMNGEIITEITLNNETCKQYK